MRTRRPVDWVIRPEGWATSIEFVSGLTEVSFVPLTVWQASMSSTGAMLPQSTGLFEPGESLTVERVRLTLFIFVLRFGDQERFWQHSFRLRVGEEDLDDPVDVGTPNPVLDYDTNSPAWANEDFLWEDRYVLSTVQLDQNTSPTFQFPVIKMTADVKSRRRLEPPDQLQLVVQRDFDGDIVPVIPLRSTVVVYARTLLSNGGK